MQPRSTRNNAPFLYSESYVWNIKASLKFKAQPNK